MGSEVGMSEKERLIELMRQAFNVSDDNYVTPNTEQVVDYLLENSVIVLPVKVGQTVYYIGGIYNGMRPIRSGTIEGIVITPKGVSELWINGGNGIYYLRTTKENFYLTKEEAEKALKGGAE